VVLGFGDIRYYCVYYVNAVLFGQYITINMMRVEPIIEWWKKFSEQCLNFANKFYRSLKRGLESCHAWLKKDLPKLHPLNAVNIVLSAVVAYIATDWIMTFTLVNFTNINNQYVGWTILIFAITMGVLEWAFEGIYERVTGVQAIFPPRYKFLFLMISIPSLLYINKLLILIKTHDKETEPNN